MPNDFYSLIGKSILRTEYNITDKEIIDDWFEIDLPESIPLRLKNTLYYLKKLKEKEFKQQLNKL